MFGVVYLFVNIGVWGMYTAEQDLFIAVFVLECNIIHIYTPNVPKNQLSFRDYIILLYSICTFEVQQVVG